MSRYVTPVGTIRDPVPVSTLETIIIAPTNMAGDDMVSIELINNGTDSLDAYLETSINGEAPWTPFTNDVFAAMAAGSARTAVVQAELGWVRVRGQFGVTPGNVLTSFVRSRAASRK